MERLMGSAAVREALRDRVKLSRIGYLRDVDPFWKPMRVSL